MDNFLGEPLATYVRQELQILHRDGGLTQSELAGGKTGKNLRYSMSKVGAPLCSKEVLAQGTRPEEDVQSYR